MMRETGISRPYNLVFLGVLLASISLLAFANLSLLLPLVIAGIIFVAWTYGRSEVWLFFAILFHAVFVRRGQDISAAEILFGLYFHGFLAYWILDRVLIRAAPLVNDRAGAWLLGFLMFSLATFGIGRLGNADTGLWFREVATTSTLFLYFPAREIMKTERGEKLVLGALLLLSTGLALYNITMYTGTAAAAEFYGGLLGKRQPGSVHFFFSMVVVVSAALIHNTGTMRERLVLIGVLGINVAALLATFTRGFWVAAIVALFLVFVLAERRRKVSMVIGLSAAIAAGILLLVSVWGELGVVALQSVATRFLSAAEAFQDVSFTNRIAESAALIDAILKSPVLGHGFGASFHYHNLLTGASLETWYAHNGYLFLLFKVGVVGTAAFLAFYGVALFRGYRLARNLVDFRRPFVHSSWAVLASLLIVTVTSNVFIERESLLLISLASAFLTNRYDRTLGLNGHTPATG